LVGKIVEVRELKGNRIELIVKGFSVAYVNAIRRLVLSEVPTMAVDFAYFYENSTDVYDEMIAHRLGLLVLKSDEALSKYAPPEACADSRPPNPKCFVEIFLDVGLEESASTGFYVKASEFRVSDSDVLPVYPDTPITYIAPGQRLHVVAYARLGRGKEHAKWSPASLSVLRYTPIVSYDSSKATRECLECVKAYKEVLEALRRGGSGVLELYGLVNTGGLRYCAETACKDVISIKYDPGTLQLVIEGTGAIRPERIVYEAVKILEDKVKSLKGAISWLGVRRD
jgi:DNA-directed RNA polymerase, alpha subunit/40 kD subunit